MDSLTNVLQKIYSPDNFAPTLKILGQITIPKMNNELALLLRNVIRINNKDIHQYRGLLLAVKIIQQSLNYDYIPEDWSTFGENFSCLIMALFESILLYQNSSHMKDVAFCNLILEAGKSLLPIVYQTDILRVSINSNGFSSILQIICLEELDFLVRKEIFLLYKPIIVKSDTRQRKIIMNNCDLFLSKIASFIIICGDYETQEAIVEILMRFSYSTKQKLNKLYFWFRNYPSVLTSIRLLDYKNFDISCRKFLNAVNDTIKSDDKVLTLSCLEAYANDIQLQKPNSEEYKEFWVDFSLKSGIIHIVCDSGANAWLRLFVESKNVRKSFFSSRLFKKNENEINGKQILLELISPLEIELHFKENLIVTVTLLFAESPQLVYLQTNFFDKWYQHSNKAEKNNQFGAVSKAFRASIHQRCKYQEKFFSSPSVSSLSSIHSFSTCSVQHGCQKRGHPKFPSLKCLSFSTSTPKESAKFQQESSTNPNLEKQLGPHKGKFWSSPSAYVSLQSTPSVSGGIFNYARSHVFQSPEIRSSLARGISISEEKEEDALFKKMMEESLRKRKGKHLNSSCKSEASEGPVVTKPGSLVQVEAQNDSASSTGSLKRKLFTKRTSKNNITNVNKEKDIISDKNGASGGTVEDNSEGNTFILSTYKNKTNTLSNGISSPSQVEITSDEAPAKSIHKQINLLNLEKKAENSFKTLKSQESSEKSVIFDKDGEDVGSQASALKDKFSYRMSNKPVPHSRYFKEFNLNNSLSSDRSDRILTRDINDNRSEKVIIPKNKENNPVFQLKPPVLYINNINKNEPMRQSQHDFSFPSSNKKDAFKNTNEESTDRQNNKTKTSIFQCEDFDKGSDKVKVNISNKNKVNQPKHKDLKVLSINNRNGKRKCNNELEKLRNVKMKADINCESEDEMFIHNKNVDTHNTDDLVDRRETNIIKEICDKKQNCSYDLNSNTKQTKDDFSLPVNEKQTDEGVERNTALVKKNNPFLNKNDIDLYKASNFDNIFSRQSYHATEHSEKTSNNISQFDNCLKEKNPKVAKRLSPEKRSQGSTGTQGNSSLVPNTTNSSLQSYHCLAIPQKTYSTSKITAKAPATPDKIFDGLKRQTTKKEIDKKKPEKRKRSTSRKRKLYTPNSSLEETSPYKPGEDCVLPAENLKQINPPGIANERKLIPYDAFKQPKKEQPSKNQKPAIDIYNFTDSSHSLNGEEEVKRTTIGRKSLRRRGVKNYKEISSDDSFVTEEGFINKKKKNILKQKTPKIKTNGTTSLALPSEKLSVSEKVSKFVLSISEVRQEVDMTREEDLESEMELHPAPVADNLSEVSQLEVAEPPVWLSAGGIDLPMPKRSVGSGSDVSLTAPTELNPRGYTKEVKNEIDFLQSVIKSIECLSLTVKRKPPKINSQEKLVRTVESFTSTSVEEMNTRWEETRKSLEHMLSNLNNLSESCNAFMMSFEKRMKDMIESLVNEFNTERSNNSKQGEILCKELKKMCQERHKLLKNH